MRVLKISSKDGSRQPQTNIFESVVLDMYKKGLDAKFIAMDLRIPYKEVLGYINKRRK